MPSGREACDPCEQLNSFLYAYADGELESDTSERLARHLESCDDCSDRVDAEMHVRELMRRCYAQEAPSELRARVLASVRVTHLRAEWD
ncbi:MAG: mycothiol system anti-sigma-R factor [Actinomycetaceae bacterium]|nr:mycothiol system anti-sigma-R factor [Actinomycetaceae bacterium]